MKSMFESLTDREMEVAKLILKGLSNRLIGESLGIKPGTAANHVRSILRKTKLTNRTQIAMELTRNA
jgi:DNA-binding CsgD family transcriptional regulator